MQSPFLLGRLSDTYINLAIGMGNRDMIDSGERGVIACVEPSESFAQ